MEANILNSKHGCDIISSVISADCNFHSYLKSVQHFICITYVLYIQEISSVQQQSFISGKKVTQK